MNNDELLTRLREIVNDAARSSEALNYLSKGLDLKPNHFHPLVFIGGTPTIGKNVYIGFLSEVNAKGSQVTIGDNCDIASFVSINVADSHKISVGSTNTIERKPIVLEDHVFVGSHCFIGGGTHIGHHSVISAGTVLVNAGMIPPYSLVVGPRPVIKPGYYGHGLPRGPSP